MKTVIQPFLLSLVIFGAGCLPQISPSPVEPQVVSVRPVLPPSGSQGAAADSKNGAAPKPSAGAYVDYASDIVIAEQAKGQKIVLFFHAKWCPYCRAADAAFLKNPDKIPAGITLLKADYDSEKSLKEKYGVANQHTFVQIDAGGNQVAKWVSGDIQELVANVK